MQKTTIKFQKKLGHLDFSMISVAPRALENDFKPSAHRYQYLQNLDTLLIYQVRTSQPKPFQIRYMRSG